MYLDQKKPKKTPKKTVRAELDANRKIKTEKERTKAEMRDEICTAGGKEYQERWNRRGNKKDVIVAVLYEATSSLGSYTSTPTNTFSESLRLLTSPRSKCFCNRVR